MRNKSLAITGLWLVLFTLLIATVVPQVVQAQTASLTLQLSRPIPSQRIGGSGHIFYSSTFDIDYTTGTLKLAGDKTGKFSFWTDDLLTLKVTHADNSVATFTGRNPQDCTPPISHTPLDITSYFKRGKNRIEVTLKDTCGYQIGSSGLWLIGPFSYAPDYNFLYTLDFPWRRGVKEPRLLTQDWEGHWATGFALDFQHLNGGQVITGTALLAPMSGVVKKGNNGSPGLGHFVLIDAGNGWQALLAHMARPSHIADGAFVQRGDVVGFVGDSGATNTHIHVEVRRNNGKVDPAQVKSIFRRTRETFRYDSTNKTFRSTNGTANLAFARPVWATSTSDAAYRIANGNDAQQNTRWSSQISSSGEWWGVNLDTQTFNRAVINWEAAYAAKHFVGFSYDNIHYFGFNYTTNKSGVMTYNLGLRTAPYIAVFMYEHAPSLGNYSFWEFEVYRDAGLAMKPSSESATEAQPVGDLIMIERRP